MEERGAAKEVLQQHSLLVSLRANLAQEHGLCTWKHRGRGNTHHPHRSTTAEFVGEQIFLSKIAICCKENGAVYAGLS